MARVHTAAREQPTTTAASGTPQPTRRTRPLFWIGRPKESAARADTLAPAIGMMTGVLLGLAVWLGLLLPLYLLLR